MQFIANQDLRSNEKISVIVDDGINPIFADYGSINLATHVEDTKSNELNIALVVVPAVVGGVLLITAAIFIAILIKKRRSKPENSNVSMEVINQYGYFQMKLLQLIHSLGR